MSQHRDMPERSAAWTTFLRTAAPRAPVYALIDAARECDGPYQATQAGVACASLFAGDLGDKLKNVAPHLVEFKNRTSFVGWWFEQWGRSVGVLVETPVSLPDLRRHFRTLTMVRGESDRKQYYFRFYDPRVLHTFLPSCTADEVQRFFGPVTAFYCESKGGTELLAFRPDRDGVSVKRSRVDDGTMTSRTPDEVRRRKHPPSQKTDE